MICYVNLENRRMKENVKVLNIVAWADQITFLFMTKKMISFARRISSLMDDPKKKKFFMKIFWNFSKI